MICLIELICHLNSERSSQEHSKFIMKSIKIISESLHILQTLSCVQTRELGRKVVSFCDCNYLESLNDAYSNRSHERRMSPSPQRPKHEVHSEHRPYDEEEKSDRRYERRRGSYRSSGSRSVDKRSYERISHGRDDSIRKGIVFIFTDLHRFKSI